jgi:hypothetical protein
VSKVPPYHTILPEYGGERNVYHNDDACPDGNRIKAEHKRQGTDNRPLCKECAKL